MFEVRHNTLKKIQFLNKRLQKPRQNIQTKNISLFQPLIFENCALGAASAYAIIGRFWYFQPIPMSLKSNSDLFDFFMTKYGGPEAKIVS